MKSFICSDVCNGILRKVCAWHLTYCNNETNSCLLVLGLYIYTYSFSRIKCKMFLKCRMIHISIIILRNCLYLLYNLCLGLAMSYLCDLFFHFHLHFHYYYWYNLTNTSTIAFFRHFLKYLYYFWIILWKKNMNLFQIAKVQPFDVA